MTDLRVGDEVLSVLHGSVGVVLSVNGQPEGMVLVHWEDRGEPTEVFVAYLKATGPARDKLIVREGQW